MLISPFTPSGKTERGSRRRATYMGEAPQERRYIAPFDTAEIMVYRYHEHSRY